MSSIDDLTAKLARISDRQLQGLQVATNNVPNVVGGLLAWLEHAVGWEIDRRIGRHYPLQGPSAAIDTPEIADSLLALTLLAAQFRKNADRAHHVVADFLETSAAVLRAEIERPDTLQ
jgi:hypothetical protein